MWRDALFSLPELQRLGWPILEKASTTDLSSASGEIPLLNPAIPERLMSLLCHFFEARWWYYAWISFALPEAFARVLVEGQEAADYMQHLRLLWDAATFAESMEGVGHPSASGVVQLRQEIYWLDWPITQWLMRLMAHHCWVPHSTIINFLLIFFVRIGDTLCVEESHRVGRGMEKRDQQPDVLSLLSFYEKLMGENTPDSQGGASHLPIALGGIHAEGKLEATCTMGAGILHRGTDTFSCWGGLG